MCGLSQYRLSYRLSVLLQGPHATVRSALLGICEAPAFLGSHRAGCLPLRRQPLFCVFSVRASLHSTSPSTLPFPRSPVTLLWCRWLPSRPLYCEVCDASVLMSVEPTVHNCSDCHRTGSRCSQHCPLVLHSFPCPHLPVSLCTATASPCHDLSPSSCRQANQVLIAHLCFNGISHLYHAVDGSLLLCAFNHPT